MADSDSYKANKCQYWSDVEPPVCKYWDYKYRLCSYWEVTLSDGKLIQAGYDGIDNYKNSLTGDEVPPEFIPNISRPSRFPHCNMVGTDLSCKYYISSSDLEKDPRCILPDSSRHVVRRNSGKKWVYAKQKPVFDSVDKRILLVKPYMTYAHINAYENLMENGSPNPLYDGKCIGFDKDFGQYGYCTLCYGYNPTHDFKPEEDSGLDAEPSEASATKKFEGWGMGFSELQPEGKSSYYPLLDPKSVIDTVKPIIYDGKSSFKIKGDYVTLLPEDTEIILFYNKSDIPDVDAERDRYGYQFGSGYNPIQPYDKNDGFLPSRLTKVFQSELLTYTSGETRTYETLVITHDSIITRNTESVYFGRSTINELGIRLPLRYVIYNKRAELSKCRWWKGDPISFSPVIRIDPATGFYYGDIVGWSPPMEYTTTESGTVSGTLMPKDHPDYVGCICSNPNAEVYWSTAKTFLLEFHEVIPKCNGAKPECPFYTSSVCWKYCTEDKMQKGDRVLAEQILELRYYSRKTRWTPESYKKAFDFPEIFAWSGPDKMEIDYSNDESPRRFAIAAMRTYISNFKPLQIEQDEVYLSQGTSMGIPNYPTLVRFVENVRRAPLILNSFDQDPEGNNILEVTSLSHTTTTLFGEKHHCKFTAYAINTKDPELADFFPHKLFDFNSMLEIENSFAADSDKAAYLSFYNELDCALNTLLDFAPDKMVASKFGDDFDMFIIDAVSFFGNNEIFVFTKGSGSWEFDKIEFKKVFLGGVIAQTSFSVWGEEDNAKRLGEDGGSGKKKTIDYLPMYESNFMTSENNNGSITFDFIPFTTQHGDGKAEIAYVYNDSAISIPKPGGMCRGLPVKTKYERGKPFKFRPAFYKRTKYIWQNSDAGGPFRYGCLKQPECPNGTFYIEELQNGIQPLFRNGDKFSSNNGYMGVISGHPVCHHISAYPDEYNEAYEGDPTGFLYGSRQLELDDKGNYIEDAFTGVRVKNSFYEYEVGYKVYKILHFDGFLYPDKKWHKADEEPIECDPENPSTCEGNLKFFGSGGYVLVTIPDDEKKLSMSPLPWASQLMEYKGGSYSEVENGFMWTDKEMAFYMYVDNPNESSDSDEPFGIIMIVAARGGDLPDNQILLKPEEELEQAGLEPCSARLRLKIYRLEKRSFGEIPELPVGETFEEISDEVLSSNPDVSSIVNRSLDYETDENGLPAEDGRLLDSYEFPGLEANLTGSVKLKEIESGEGRTSYEITGFDVDPLLIAVVFRSSLTGRIRGMTRTKMITWVRQPYCRDVFISYAWERAYNRDRYTYKTVVVPDPTGGSSVTAQIINIYDPECKGETTSETYEYFAAAYSPFYPYTDYAPVQYERQRRKEDRPARNGGPLGLLTDVGIHLSSMYVESSGADLLHNFYHYRMSSIFYATNRMWGGGAGTRRGHDPKAYIRHAYFTPQAFEELPEKHGFFDARMLVPFTSYAEVGSDLTPKENDVVFKGVGVYMGGLSEEEKKLYYSICDGDVCYPLQGHDVLSTGYVGYTPMNIYGERRIYGGPIGPWAVTPESEDRIAYDYTQLTKWSPHNDMKTYPPKFGNVCRDYLSSFRSIDNVYFKSGRISAAMYPDVKVRRERMVDPNKTGIFNNECLETRVAYEAYRKELEDYDDSYNINNPNFGTRTSPRSKVKEVYDFAGVDIPDYYYRKWIPVNYSYTDCDITGSNVKDYPFDLYTTDYDSPFVHPMGLFLVKDKIENINISEYVPKEEPPEGEDPEKQPYLTYTFEEVFCADKLDIESFDKNNENPYSNKDKISLIHPSARYYEDSGKRSLYWYVYRPWPIPLRDVGFDETVGKPEDWGKGVDTDIPAGGEEQSKLAIHWAWRAPWRSIERQALSFKDYKECDTGDVNYNITDTTQSEFNPPYSKDDSASSEEKILATGRLLFLSMDQPDYQMDGQLFEHRLVCSDTKFLYPEAQGYNHKIKFIPPPKSDEGRYEHHVFFIQLDDGPPRGFTIGSDPNEDKDKVGKWDPEALDTPQPPPDPITGETPPPPPGLEIPGYDQLNAKQIYDLYTKCCGTNAQVDQSWIRVTCPTCDGYGTIGSNTVCPLCEGDKRISPITLLSPGYTSYEPSEAKSRGREIKRYSLITEGSNSEYKTQEFTYHRGLDIKLLPEKFKFLPIVTRPLEPDAYETCFARKDTSGNAETILPESVNSNYVEAGEFYALNDRFMESVYLCPSRNVSSHTAEVIFDFKTSSYSEPNPESPGVPLPPKNQLRSISKIVLQFLIGTGKDDYKIVLYHKPAVRFLGGLSGSVVYYVDSENMTLTKKPAPGAAIGLIDPLMVTCEFPLSMEAIFDPQQYFRIEMRINPTENELKEQGLLSYYYDSNIVNKVYLQAVYLYYSEYIETIEYINTYEKRFYVSIGEYGDIYPNRFVPNKNEEDELKCRTDAWMGRRMFPINVNIWKAGLYPSGQQPRSLLSSVYEEDSPDGVIGHKDSSGELAYMSKCRGRILSNAVKSGTSLNAQGGEGGSTGLSGDVEPKPLKLKPVDGSVKDVQEWEKLQEKNYNKVTGHAGDENIKGAGSTKFTMKSICPPGLDIILKELKVSEFPTWECVFTNSVVPPLTPTIQHEPYNHEGYKNIYHYFARKVYNSRGTALIAELPDYQHQVRSIFYEQNQNLVPYADWDYEMENREMLRLQKEYYYRELIPNQPWEETTYNYPYPVDAFHTVVRNAITSTHGWGCPDPEPTRAAEGWELIYQYSPLFLSTSNVHKDEITPFDSNHKFIEMMDYVTEDTHPFYCSIDKYKENGSMLYGARLVVDKRISDYGYIVIPPTEMIEDWGKYASTDFFKPYLL